jgi:hypothetical protein
MSDDHPSYMLDDFSYPNDEERKDFYRKLLRTRDDYATVRRLVQHIERNVNRNEDMDSVKMLCSVLIEYLKEKETK